MRLGAVIEEDADTVTRVVQAVLVDGALRAGQRASWSGIYYRDPADAGLEAEDVVVETPVGPAPAWLIRSTQGESDRWVIHIHGLGSPRAGTLRGVRVAAEAGLTSLVVTYRNDGEGPRVGSGRSALGATETEDVRAAMRYALDHGARNIVLFGWSMGAAIALQLAADPEFLGVIDQLVLESPVLDWQATINANCARSGLPARFGVFARPWLRIAALARLVGLDAAVSVGTLDSIPRAEEISLPILILHGSEDASSPIDISRRFARLQHNRTSLETFHADHTMTWNSDPSRWSGVLAAPLTAGINSSG